MSLAALLDGDDGLLVHADGRDWSRAEVQARATALADSLRTAGVAPGAAVAVQLPSGAELIATLFAVWTVGAAYVPVNPRATADEVARINASVAPVALVTSSGIAPTGVGREYADDVALIQFTSGTTGKPKPVLLLHGGVLELIDGVVDKLRGSGGGRPAKAPMSNLVPVSLSLWAGLYQVLFAFRLGAPVVVMDGFDTLEFARLVRRFEIRSTVLPPAAMVMLADDDDVDDLAPLAYVRSITAPLSPLQARRFHERFGVAVLNSYGQTEIGGEIVGWNAADWRAHGDDKLGAVGRPHAGVDVRTADDGEIQVSTPALSAGYADGADLADRLTADGWFRTGDVGWVDDDGFVWIEGRLSDMVNRGGLKIHPGEVEEVLLLSPAVSDAAVVGIADDRLGEVPWAFVVAGDGGAVPIDPAQLDHLCRAHLAPYKVPVRFEVVRSLPRNEVGKVLRAELAAGARVTSREPKSTRS